MSLHRLLLAFAVLYYTTPAVNIGCGAPQKPVLGSCAKELVQNLGEDLLARLEGDGGPRDVEASEGLARYAKAQAAKHGVAAVRCALWEVVGRLRGRLESQARPMATGPSRAPVEILRAEDLLAKLSS